MKLGFALSIPLTLLATIAFSDGTARGSTGQGCDPENKVAVIGRKGNILYFTNLTCFSAQREATKAGAIKQPDAADPDGEQGPVGEQGTQGP